MWTWILVVQTAYNCSPYYIPDYFRVGRENPRTMKRFTSVKYSWFWTQMWRINMCCSRSSRKRFCPCRTCPYCLSSSNLKLNSMAFFFFFNCWGCLTLLETAFSWLYSFHSPEPPCSYHLIRVHNTPGTVLKVCRALSYIILTAILFEILLQLTVCR